MNIPICFYCCHKIKGRLKCAAFADELIPQSILIGENPHLIPYKNQVNELVFNPTMLFVSVIEKDSESL